MLEMHLSLNILLVDSPYRPIVKDVWVFGTDNGLLGLCGCPMEVRDEQ